jgi:hypothetical protein
LDTEDKVLRGSGGARRLPFDAVLTGRDPVGGRATPRH